MTEGLKALEELKEEIKWTHNDGKTLTKYDAKRVETIEKELERLEVIDNADPSEAMNCLHTIAFNTQFIAGMNFGNELRTIESALLKAQEQEKTLEIIINKRVDMYALVIAYDLEDYNNMIKHTYELTQQEFDILKEVIGNE